VFFPAGAPAVRITVGPDTLAIVDHGVEMTAMRIP
jgi:hypothetical protein